METGADEVLPRTGPGWQARRVPSLRPRRSWSAFPAVAGALIATTLFLSGCSGGGGSSSSATVAPAARLQGALAAARACRMWSELATPALKAFPLNPTAAAPFDAKSAAIATVANAASAADPTWNNLATDVAGATDFASAALPDINNRITTDCRQLPADAVKTVTGEPDPFSTTTTKGP
jgi:hypothetical protein